MTPRTRVLRASLWLAVIGLGTWAGGTLYQMLVVVPLWSAAPPESVRAFFEGTRYNETVFRFFGPPFMAARTLPLLVALAAGWHLPRHRRALLVAVACFVAFAVPFTFAFVYPINAVLFEQAGGGAAPEEVRRLVDQWIVRDRIRFAVGAVGVLAVLHAFRLPVAEGTDARAV